MNPLEMVKKTIQDFNEFSFSAHEPLKNGKTTTLQAVESLNFEVQARS